MRKYLIALLALGMALTPLSAQVNKKKAIDLEEEFF